MGKPPFDRIIALEICLWKLSKSCNSLDFDLEMNSARSAMYVDINILSYSHACVSTDQNRTFCVPRPYRIMIILHLRGPLFEPRNCA